MTAIPEGTLLLVDGGTAELIKEPTADQQATATTVRSPRREALAGPGSTADGHRVALLANITSPDDVSAALECGAEGVGLYRTELCFLDRTKAPAIAEQVSALPCGVGGSADAGWWSAGWMPVRTRRCRSLVRQRSSTLPWAFAASVRLSPIHSCFVINWLRLRRSTTGPPGGPIAPRRIRCPGMATLDLAW